MHLATRPDVQGMEVMPEAIGLAFELPAGFQALPVRRLQRLDRRLGYFGSNRFVLFYYEPQGQEVVWDDGYSYGFACGGWQAFIEDVMPIAEQLGADLGDSDRRGAQALVVDRMLGQVFCAAHADAKRFVHDRAVAAA